VLEATPTVAMHKRKHSQQKQEHGNRNNNRQKQAVFFRLWLGFHLQGL
jgi:hypothetical protein